MKASKQRSLCSDRGSPSCERRGRSAATPPRQCSMSRSCVVLHSCVPSASAAVSPSSGPPLSMSLVSYSILPAAACTASNTECGRLFLANSASAIAYAALVIAMSADIADCLVNWFAAAAAAKRTSCLHPEVHSNASAQVPIKCVCIAKHDGGAVFCLGIVAHGQLGG